jgi:hypothetical protein
VTQQNQAWRLIARSFVGLAASCALVLQLMLIGLATGSLAASASPDDPFVICYGNGNSGPADHGSDGKPINPLHCLLACAQAHGSAAAAALPASAAILELSPASGALGPDGPRLLLLTPRGLTPPPRGPPTSA